MNKNDKEKKEIAQELIARPELFELMKLIVEKDLVHKAAEIEEMIKSRSVAVEGV